MSKKLDLVGQTFGRLTVLSYSHKTKDKRQNIHHYWNCKCECGNKKIARQDDLIYGRTKSCGCLKHGKLLTGMKFGRLTVIEEAPPQIRKDKKGRKKMWKCLCECGNESIVSHELLVGGHTKSCGCLQLEGHPKNPELIRNKYPRLYKIWLSMRARCNNPKDQHHKNYHDRGIRICNEWNTFEPFCEWALSHGYNDNLTIERRDVNGNYSPINCKWIPFSEQQKNKTNTRYYSIDGILYTADEASQRFHIKKNTFVARVNRYGFTPEEAISIPVKKWGTDQY